VIWVCASLGCKVRVCFVSYIRSSCPVWVSVYCLSFITGERVTMGSVEQEKKKLCS